MNSKNSRRDFIVKAFAVGAVGFGSGALARQVICPHARFLEIDHEYVSKIGKPWPAVKRGGIIEISREVLEDVKSGKHPVELPQGHIIDIGYDFYTDMHLFKMWGDTLPIVEEGCKYPRIMVITRYGNVQFL